MYSHFDNAGSVFDIFKHAVLLKSVERKKPKTYFETHCGFSSYSKPEIWESSWAKVHKWTQSLSLTICGAVDMTLCDINPAVGDTIPSYDTFEFKCTDGFKEGLKSTADLTFIDPSYVDYSDWMDAEYLISQIKNWIVWYPIFTDGFSVHGVSVNTISFDAPKIEMLWKTDHRMPGCGMAFSKEFTEKDLQFIYNCVPFIAWSLSASDWTYKGFSI